jgi:HEAT repeat protein
MLIGDADKGAKSQALEQVVEFGLDYCYPELDAAIRNNDNADLRNAAMEVMVCFAGQAVPRLIVLLHDKDEEVRNFSTVMLGEIANRESVAALIHALRDPDANVRHGAAEALGNIGDRSALFPILELLKEDFWSQYPAVVALGEMRDSRAVPYLLKLLDDEMLAIPAIIALGKIGDPRVLFTLGEIIEDQSILRAGAAIEAIVAIENSRREMVKYKQSLVLFAQAEMSLPDILPKNAGEHLQRILNSASSASLKVAVITLLGWIGDISSVPIMIALLEGEENLSESIVTSLTAMGSKVIPAIEQYLNDSSVQLRVMLLRVLRQLQHDLDIFLLIQLLDTTEKTLLFEVLETIKGKSYGELYPRLIRLAVTETGAMQDLVLDVLKYYPHDLIDEFIKQLKVSAITNERIAAAKLIGSVGNEQFAEVLGFLLNDTDKGVQSEAVKAIGKGRYISAQPLLLGLLSSGDVVFREEIVWALAEFGYSEHLDSIVELLGIYGDHLDFAIIKAAEKMRSYVAVNKLVKYLDREHLSPHLLVSALTVLGDLSSNEEVVLNAISRHLHHPDNDIRRIATIAYAKTAGESAWSKILDACGDAHWSVRIAALQSLVKTFGDKALPRVLEGLHDPDLFVRKNAVSLIGELQNIRSLTPLIQLILDPDLGLTAFESLRKLGKYGLPWLHRAINGDYPVELRERVIDLIGIIGDRKSVEPLLDALEDTNHFIRLAAIDSLVFCYDSLPLKKLLNMKKYDTDEDVRNKADMALQLLTIERYF